MCVLSVVFNNVMFARGQRGGVQRRQQQLPGDGGRLPAHGVRSVRPDGQRSEADLHHRRRPVIHDPGQTARLPAPLHLGEWPADNHVYISR